MRVVIVRSERWDASSACGLNGDKRWEIRLKPSEKQNVGWVVGKGFIEVKTANVVGLGHGLYLEKLAQDLTLKCMGL